MFVTYKTTNLLTGQYYIGSHKTDDPYDDYMGSGKLLKDSIATYGLDNHKKEIVGVFDNRQDSLDLEHKLIQEKRNTDKNSLLNKSLGGRSFDYINEHLTFDRAAYGALASHESSHKAKLERESEYAKHPNRCAQCGCVLPYRHRTNRFCNSSCAASYNNVHRDRPEREHRYCMYCGSDITTKPSVRRFCSNHCSSLYYAARRERSTLRQTLVSDIDVIRNMHNTKTYREIAAEYGTSATTIKDLLKGRLS